MEGVACEWEEAPFLAIDTDGVPVSADVFVNVTTGKVFSKRDLQMASPDGKDKVEDT